MFSIVNKALQTVEVFHFQATVCMEDKFFHWKCFIIQCVAEVFCFQIRRERLSVFLEIQLITNCTCNGRSVFDLFHIDLFFIFLPQGSIHRHCLLVFIGISAWCWFQPTKCDFFLSDSTMTIVGYVTVPVSLMYLFFQDVVG